MHPITKRAQWHRGLDIGAPKGTEIHAMWAGRISRARQLRHGYGNYVVLETPKHKVLYAHLSKILVEKGAHVKKGDLIGLMGESGRATGPHLHLEVRKGRRRIDPDQFLGHCPDLP